MGAAVRQRSLRGGSDRLHIPLYRLAGSGATRNCPRRRKDDRVRSRQQQAVRSLRKHGRGVQRERAGLSAAVRRKVSRFRRQPTGGHGGQHEDGRPVRGAGAREPGVPVRYERQRRGEQCHPDGSKRYSSDGYHGPHSRQPACRFRARPGICRDSDDFRLYGPRARHYRGQHVGQAASPRAARLSNRRLAWIAERLLCAVHGDQFDGREHHRIRHGGVLERQLEGGAGHPEV